MLFFINQVIAEPHKKALNYITPQEYQSIVIDYNQTEQAYPQEKTIHKLFEEQAFEDKKLTYHELNSKANQLANYILKYNEVRPDDIIGLFLNRSEYTVISILAVLKTGAGYVPISPMHPDELIKYILEDTKAKIVLKEIDAKCDILAKKQYLDINVIEINAKEVQKKLLKEKDVNPEIAMASSHLLYVLYTSGTTGRPKGVMQEHKGCVNRILEMIRISKITEKERVLFKTNYMFDVSFSDIFTTLLAGASLYITKEFFDPQEIVNLFKKYQINVCHFTPSQFELMKDFYKEWKFKVLHFSGEALDTKILEGLNKKISCINYYGPTE